MEKNAILFNEANDPLDTFEEHLKKLRVLTNWASEVDVQAMSHMLNARIQVYRFGNLNKPFSV